MVVGVNDLLFPLSLKKSMCINSETRRWASILFATGTIMFLINVA